jgi:hypothetical protein
MGKKEQQSKHSKYQQIVRFNLIFGCLNNGLTSDEIQKKLDGDIEKRYSSLRGECSTSTVKRIITKLPFKKYPIKEILETKPYSYEDVVKKHDLILICNDPINTVGIQVKSSQTGVNLFYTDNFHSNIDIAKKMALEKKLIILNGALEDFVIQKRFCEQFEIISDRCKMLKYPHG